MFAFKKSVAELKKIIVDSKEIAKEIGADSNLDMFDILLEKLRNPQLYLSVVGRTSSGKTTLINSLLGKEVLAQNAAPTTATVTEVFNSNDDKLNYYQISDELERIEICEDEFNKITHSPESFKGRLQMEVPDFNYNLKARLFDTPGYDSIYDEHSEVLDSFIPESDFLVFTVLYRAGLVQADREFLELLYEIFADQLPPMVLVVNRIPPEIDNEDRRIKEIKKDVAEIINQEITTFYVSEDRRENISLPDTTELWKYLAKETNKPERNQELINNVSRVLKSLLDKLKDYIFYYKKIEQSNNEKIEQLKEEIESLMEEKRRIYELVGRKKKEILSKCYDELTKAENEIFANSKAEIERASRWSKASECSSYLTNHLLPQEANKLSKKVGKIVFKELEQLNREISDMVNTAIGNFETQVKDVILERNIFVENMMKKSATKGINSVAFTFFAKFGGQGGAGAGVANFASKTLKNVGNLFNKKFSLATHNGLKKFLSKIGATSAKGIQTGIVILVEALVYLWKVATWKTKLKTKTKEAIDEWASKLKLQFEEEISKSIKETKKLVKETIDYTTSDLKEIIKQQQEQGKFSSEELDKHLKRVEIKQGALIKVRSFNREGGLVIEG
ncbi:dynamin family protein [Fuchsiella alkaliacetigena]|uniref:dynamin family protein n=1 Tax=Fuchsiella alkaliacetigena TaxID=957042 RepID=UPI00200B3E4D|nr:dynamin family protein [Fuchsiella alkaliacetigena]MCK8825256.1 dynamin family protein [Fuchsiella alkaliacetigena]